MGDIKFHVLAWNHESESKIELNISVHVFKNNNLEKKVILGLHNEPLNVDDVTLSPT